MKIKGLQTPGLYPDMLCRLLFALVALSVTTIGAAATAYAQTPEAWDPLQSLPESELVPDPPTVASEVTARHRSVRGTSLRADAHIEETHHDVQVQFRAGLALVRHEIGFRNGGTNLAEARIRIPLQSEEDIARLEACRNHACQRAEWVPLDAAENSYRHRSLLQGDGEAPLAFAKRVNDSGGAAALIWISPITPGEGTRIVLHTIQTIDIHGESSYVHMAARGDDPRLSPLRVTGFQPNQALLDAEPQIFSSRGPMHFVSPWHGGAQDQSVVWRFRDSVSGRPILYTYMRRADAASTPRHLVVLIDRSPSTLGGVRNRLMHILLGLTNIAPEGSRISVIAFAREVHRVQRRPIPIDELSLQELSQALAPHRGNRTNIEGALAEAQAIASQTRLRPLFLILTDGAFAAPSDMSNLPETSIVLGGDLPTWSGPAALASETSGQVLPVQEQTDLAIRTGDFALLNARLRSLFQSSPIPWAIIRTGEGPPNEVQLRPGQGHRSLDRVNRSQWSVTQRGRVIRALPAPEIWAEGLEARAHRLSGESPRGLLAAASNQPLRTTAPACETAAASSSGDGALPPGATLFLSEPRQCGQSLGGDALFEPPPPSSLPAEAVLHRLRTRVIPPARGCLRADRRGRAHHSVRATFTLVLARREVVTQSVEGDLTRPLRDCLLRSLDTLDVPSFQGSLRIRYPIYTQAERPPIVEHRTDLWH